MQGKMTAFTREKILANKSEVLGGDEWVQLRKLKMPSLHINGYTYSHEIRCNGIVAFLPFRESEQEDRIEVLLRHEAVPCWEFDTPLHSAFTGGIDEGMTALDTAVKELKEEAGYEVEPNSNRVINLGKSFGTKSCDTIYHLFAFNVTGLEAIDLTVESDLEKSSTNLWTHLFSETMLQVSEPFIHMLGNRLSHILMGANNGSFR